MKLKSFISILALFCLISGVVTAQEQKPDMQTNKNVFKATVDLGVLFENTTSTTSTYGSDKISDYGKEGEAANYTTLFPLLDLRYILTESKTQLYFGTPTDGENYEVGAGVIQPFSQLGNLTAIIAISAGTEEWENPYETDVTREKTDLNELSIKLKLARVGTTAFDISLLNKNIRLENDEIGKLLPDLEREGTVNNVQLSYAFSINQTNRIIPGLKVEKADLEGGANSYDKAELNLHYIRFSRTFVLMLQASASNALYKDIHPLYDETRNETGVGLGVRARIPNLFDIQSLHTNMSISGERIDSNIDFFDSQTIDVVLTLGYSF